jgi:hypothetical protein
MRDKNVQILVNLDIQLRKKLKIQAITKNTTLNNLLVEYITNSYEQDTK